MKVKDGFYYFKCNDMLYVHEKGFTMVFNDWEGHWTNAVTIQPFEVSRGDMIFICK